MLSVNFIVLSFCPSRLIALPLPSNIRAERQQPGDQPFSFGA